ncbi:MAG: hypothetical protein JST79_18115 [Acidobacteria bacterium]|nr:hypothetical protein [Acidobacteriota bacterium]
MKIADLKPLAFIIVISLALFSLTGFAGASDSQVITKKGFKALLKTAKEPVEHRKIAEYYRQEAARLTASAKEHEELAHIYANKPPFPAMEAKHGTSFGQGAPHCKRWAELSSAQAKEALSLAEMHEEMARAAEQK